MTTVFVDTSYYLAILSASDQYHERAVHLSRLKSIRHVTTEFILLELGNFLVNGADRVTFHQLVQKLSTSPSTRVIPASSDLLKQGYALFTSRADKAWSLTDCVSFHVMDELSLVHSFTSDQHFVQAGFSALLREGTDVAQFELS
jgi:predicted nucleic acid-binding protein